MSTYRWRQMGVASLTSALVLSTFSFTSAQAEVPMPRATPAVSTGIGSACPPEALAALATAFDDVAGSSHADAISCLRWYELGSGVGPRTYGPAGAVSRAQLASFVVRLVEQAGVAIPPTKDAFRDDDGAVHEGNIDAAAALGLLRGRTDGTFGGEVPVQRAQLATVLAAVLDLAGASAPSGSDAFLDDDDSVHEKAIDALAALGIVQGKDGDRFDPAAPVRRDQLASFLMRVVNRFVQESSMVVPSEVEAAGVRSAVAKVSASATSATDVFVSWSAVPGAGEYRLHRTTGGASQQLMAGKGRTFGDAGLAPATSHTYVVATLKNGVETSRSVPVTVRTPSVGTAPTTTAPTTPPTTTPPTTTAPPATTPTTTAPVTAPTSCTGVSLRPGDGIQAAVDSQPTGTTFCLAAGTYARQEVRPRAGNRFIGAAGAVLDGQGVASIAFHPTADHVTIRGLTVQGYNPGAQVGAIQGGGHQVSDSRTGWVVESNVVQRNNGVGIRIGSDMVVRNNKVVYNGQLGVGGIGDRTLVEGNEIAYNNHENAYVAGWEAGGTKFVLTNGLVVRNNFVHHNTGPGLWTDIENRGTLYEGNLVEDNAEMGIFHEISFDAVIRHNTVRRNGFGMQRWCYGAGILVAHSSNVTVHDNLVEDNWNNIVGLQQTRESAEYQLRNLEVRHNTVVITRDVARDAAGNGAYAGAVCQDNGDDRVFGEWNNRFHDNTYDILDPAAGMWSFSNQRHAWGGWRGDGQDTTGVVR